jgi:hypothetical protein
MPKVNHIVMSSRKKRAERRVDYRTGGGGVCVCNKIYLHDHIVIYQEHGLTIILFQTCMLLLLLLLLILLLPDMNTLLFGGVRCGFGDAFHNHVC